MSRNAGYSLMEVLVMLAITALLSVVVLETIRASASNGIRIENAARIVAQDYLTLSSVRRAVENTRTDYQDSSTYFIGEPSQMRAVTSLPIAADSYAPHPYTLRLVEDTNSVALVYSDATGEILVDRWANARARFSYYGDEQISNVQATIQLGQPRPRAWTNTWPVANTNQSLYYVIQPLAIKVEVIFNTGDNQEIIFFLPATAPPPMRTRDLLGTTAP